MSVSETSAGWAARRAVAAPQAGTVALSLRLGLGAVFVIGGYNKLAQLIDPATQGAILGRYLSPLGYINGFFSEFLFEGPLGSVITPWGFLTTLSTFELVGGLALIVGLGVRPLALIYGFLLWSFVMALPVSDGAWDRRARDLHLAGPVGTGAGRGPVGANVRALQPGRRRAQASTAG